MATKPATGVSDLARELRTHNRAERERIHALHQDGATGLEVVHALSDLMDDIVRRAFDGAAASVPAAGRARLRLFLAAQGGYGRRQLNPESDVDLLGLLGAGAGQREEEVLKRTLHTLWDAGIKLSHAIRTLDECREIAATDLKSLTSLLEVRPLAGPEAEYRRFRRQFSRHWTGGHLRTFLEAQIRERAERCRQFGNTINVAEPNLKESAGGLRDHHFVLWLGSAFYGAASLADLQEKGVLHPMRLESAVTALDLLLRLRNALHFHTRRPVDVLSYDLQEPIALSLGYQDEPLRLAEELMMRDYYAAASTIQELSTAMVRIAEATLKRGEMDEELPVFVRPGWSLHHGKLRYDNSPQALARRPRELLEVFWIVHETGSEPSEALRYTISHHLDLIDDAFRRDPEIAERFRALLALRPRVAQLLRAMHETGFLGAYLPEWARVERLVRKDLYHRYSVDEHLLLTVHHLEHVAELAPQYRHELQGIYDRVERLDLLRLCALLHDVGKGGIIDHSVAGARLTEELMSRLGYPEEDVATVRFLILEHLLLVQTALHRDLQAPGTIEQFVERVGSLPLLDMLFLLTVADSAAVGGNQLTDWRLQLFWQLFRVARKRLEQPTLPSPAEFDARGERLVEALARDFPREEVIAHLEQLPRQYAELTPLAQIARHIALLRRYDRRTPVVDYLATGEHTLSITICTEDRVGLFARIARAFLRENLSIQGARLQNRRDGIAIDTLTVVKDVDTTKFGPERQTLFTEMMIGSILDEAPPELLPPGSFASRRSMQSVRADFKPHITVSNEVSPRHTVVHVHTFDQLGVLYTIAATFAQLGYDIHFARVNTEGARVHDVFYITGGEGLPIASAQERERLAQALRRNLGLDDTSPTLATR